MNKKISGKRFKSNQAKKEFVTILKQATLATGLILAVSLGIKYLLVSHEIEPTSQPLQAPEQPKIAEISPVTPKKVLSATEQEKLEIVRKIAEKFPEDKKILVAIAIEESGLNKNAVGYNCRYKIGGETHDKLTGTNIDISNISKEKKSGYVSTWCRKGHEKFAWSTDSGILAINQATEYQKTVKGNLETARHKYDNAGLNTWVAYSSGRYKKHIPEAQRLLAMI